MKAKHRHVDRSCYSPPLLFRLKFKREFADQSLLSENELCGRLKIAQILRDGDVPKVLEEAFGALKFGWFNVSNDSNRAAPGSIRLTGGQVLKMSRAGREVSERLSQIFIYEFANRAYRSRVCFLSYGLGNSDLQMRPSWR